MIHKIIFVHQNKVKKKRSLRTGFEPVRAEPNGFRVHLLNHSDIAAHDRLDLNVENIIATNRQTHSLSNSIVQNNCSTQFDQQKTVVLFSVETLYHLQSKSFTVRFFLPWNTIRD